MTLFFTSPKKKNILLFILLSDYFTGKGKRSTYHYIRGE